MDLKEPVMIEVNNALQITLDETKYGIQPTREKVKGLREYPAKGLIIPQMGDVNLKVAFQRNPKSVEINDDELGLIPDLWGCDAFIGIYYGKDGKRHVSLVHNTAAILLKDEGLYQAILQRKGGNKKELAELDKIVNKSLQVGYSMGEEVISERQVAEVLKDIHKPLFEQIHLISVNPDPLANILKHYCNNFTFDTAEIRDSKTGNPAGGYNVWVYNNGKSLQYITQYPGMNKSFSNELNFVEPEM